MLLLLVLICLVILAMEVPGLLRQRHYRGLLVFGVFFLAGVYLILAEFYGWPPRTLMEPLLLKLAG